MKRISSLCFLLCLTIPAWSATQTFYVGAGLGNMFYRISGNNFIGTGDGWPDDHYISPSITDEALGYLTAGFECKRANFWFPMTSVGIRYQNIAPTEIAGFIDQYSLPQFRNYQYTYSVKLQTAMLTLKSNIYRWQQFTPYVLVGAGAVDYSTYTYNEQALSNVTPRVNPGFRENSDQNFAYQLGIGFDYLLRENLAVNLELDYNYFGMIKTGNGANYVTLTDQNFSNEHLEHKYSATSLLLGFTYYMA